jgi:hypothetical protein
MAGVNSKLLCSRCGGPMSYDNKVGICNQTPECKAENKKVRTRNRYLQRFGDPEHPELHTEEQKETRRKMRLTVNAAHKKKRRADGISARVSWILKDDGIFDDVAVDIAVEGLRPIAMTEAERRCAIERLAIFGQPPAEISRRVKMCSSRVISTLSELGWEWSVNDYGEKVLTRQKPDEG